MKYIAPRGTVDILPDKIDGWIGLENILRTIAENYNVKEMRTPIFEHTELFNRAVGDTTDVVSKEMYSFEDKKGRRITLRPEGTAGIARSYVENKMYALPEKLQKVFYMGPMFRYERPQSGRQRQFHQFGVEMLGIESPYVDVECMMMALNIVQALNIKDVTLHINSLGDEASRDAYREALKDHFRPHLKELCYDCNTRFEKNPLRILDCKTDKDHPAMKSAPCTIDYLTETAKAHFDKVCELLDALEVKYVIDPNMVRGLDYYSHTIFELISDASVLGAGSTIGGGGRYNGLIEELGGPATPGVGFAFGMERLIIAMNNNHLESQHIDVYVMPLGEESKDYSMQLMAALRANGYCADMDFADRGLKGQFKSADRFVARFSFIIGEDEVENETITVKDNITKEQKQIKVEEIIDFLDSKLGVR